MTTEQNFKKGDRVAITTDKNRIVGTITNVGRKYYHITLDNGRKTMTAKENVEPYDRRTAFLTRLQSLLREFDAFFVAHKTDMPVSVYFNDNEDDVPFASIGEEVNKGCGVVVTADNIMEFDKE